MAAEPSPSCFVIMPIADRPPHKEGHFRRVYEDIIKPACITAGYSPLRADEVQQTNLIHHDILKRLVDSPMAVCDLTAHNPNVMFELAIRQAFDKPTVLVQEVGTSRIFDISVFRTIDYRPALDYREVLEDQTAISDAIRATATQGKAEVNSLIRLLSLSPATLPSSSETTPTDVLRLVISEISALRDEVLRLRRASRVEYASALHPVTSEFARLVATSGVLGDSRQVEQSELFASVARLNDEIANLELISHNPEAQLQIERRVSEIRRQLDILQSTHGDPTLVDLDRRLDILRHRIRRQSFGDLPRPPSPEKRPSNKAPRDK